MAGMGRTRLVRRSGADRLSLVLDDEQYEVVQLWEGEHILSLSCNMPSFDVDLSVLPSYAVVEEPSA